MRVLIPGIAGGVARKLALRLHEAGHQVAGIDIRPWEEAREVGIEVFRGDVRKRAAEDVFRRWHPDAVVHMATVTAFTVQGAERGRINLDGTKALFDHCAAHGVKHILFVGRHTFYGAAPDSPLYHSEDEPPRALEAIPELADLVAADLYAARPHGAVAAAEDDDGDIAAAVHAGCTGLGHAGVLPEGPSGAAGAGV
jgi:UDP-glucose 4-epimerase